MRARGALALAILAFLAGPGAAQPGADSATPAADPHGSNQIAKADNAPTRQRRHPRPGPRVAPIFDAEAKSLDVAPPKERPLLGFVGSWVYHLKNVDSAAVGLCHADLAVIDYSIDGSRARAFSREDVERMKSKPDGRKMKLISYMSIGEAEDYRDLYWKPEWRSRRPTWLGPENPNWGGNYNVRYWQPEWQRLMFGSRDAYLDTLIANGFDGVYLDIVDGFEFWQDASSPDGSRISAASDMVAFVSALARYAWSKAPGFLIIPQNGEALLRHPGFRAHISAIATEDVDYRGVTAPPGESREDDVERQPEAVTRQRRADLKLAIDDQITVLSVEYLMDQPEDMLQMVKAAAAIRQHRHVPHFTVRQLDRLHCTMAN